MNPHLSVPSKTYLTGEYAVLAGGQALVLNTTPRFELRAEEGMREVIGIPEGSPASVWLRARSPLLENWKIEFLDPHQGAGGFGASGAQFILVHAFTTYLQNSRSLSVVDPVDVFNDYQICSKRTGSGADVLAQIRGQVAQVDMSDKSSRAVDWPYPELGFQVVRTGRKMPTHEHLRSVKPGDLKLLLEPAREAFGAFGKVSAEEFVDKVNAFGHALRELNLQSPYTLEKLEPFKNQDWCLSAKGCGAWGADTILLLFAKEHAAKARAFTDQLGLPFVTAELSSGL